MGKKKKEHVVFDNMLTQKKGIPFGKVNQDFGGKGSKNNMMNRSVSKTFNRKTP